ncbi:MAG: PAS domain S-box protein [Zetaproteobacteria bacterium]|nr:PAS domain S-box protein [Zetaproteobacteria bacterium]
MFDYYHTMSLRSKILLPVLLPLLGFIYFIIDDVGDARISLNVVEDIEHELQLLGDTVQLTRALERERLLATIYLKERSEHPHFGRFDHQFNVTNEILSGLTQSSYASINALYPLVAISQKVKRERSALVANIKACTIDYAAMQQIYTGWILQQQLAALQLARSRAFAIHAEGVEHISLPMEDLVQMLNAFDEFGRLFEAVSQQQLQGVEIFMDGRVGAEQKNALMINRDLIARIHERILLKMQIEDMASYQRIRDSQRHLIDQLDTIVVGVIAQHQMVTPDLWVGLTDDYRAALLQLERELLKHIQVDVASASVMLVDRLWWNLIVSLFVLLICFVGSYLLVNNFSNSLSALIRYIRQIAEGTFDPSTDLETIKKISRSGDALHDVLWATIDMSEALNATQSQLVEQEKQAHRIQSSMAEGLIVVDTDVKIIEVNEALCQLLGYQADELIGLPCKHLFKEHETDFVSAMGDLLGNRLQRFYSSQPEKFFATMAQLPISIVIVNDVDGKVTFFNDHACKTFGYSRKEALTKSVDDLVPRSLRGTHVKHRETFARSKRAKQMSRRGHLNGERKGGELFEVEIGLFPIQIDGLESTLAIVHDLQNDPSWAFIQRTEIGRLFAEESDGEAELTRLRDKDGDLVPTMITSSSLVAEDGSVIGGVLVVNDVRKYMRAIEKVRDAEHSLEQEQHQRLESLGLMAGGVAHDFNNLLTPIIGSAELLQTLLSESPSNVHAHLKCIVDASKQASRLSKQMLSYSGSGRLASEPIGLSRMIAQMRTVLESSVASNVSLIFRIDQRVRLIDADVVELEQVILNMVINASDAMNGHSGKIAIGTMEHSIDQAYLDGLNTHAKSSVLPGDYVAFAISDNGCGMPPSVLKKLFDPFFTTKFTGRGLGMSAVLGIVHSHHGVLNVNSSEGVGTTFTVSFPISKHVENSSENVDASINGVSMSEVVEEQPHYHVLVIDDDDLVAMVLQARLQQLGHTVEIAVNGLEGLQRFSANPVAYDVIILDMTMPVMSGDECFAELVKVDPDVKVIISSGYAKTDLTAKLNEGLLPAAYLPKPYEMSDLQMALIEAFF